MKKATAVIWRESVYKGDFRCNVCKEKLSEAGTEPLDNVLYGLMPDGTGMLFCPMCKNHVAYVRHVDVEDDVKGGMFGHWDDRKDFGVIEG